VSAALLVFAILSAMCLAAFLIGCVDTWWFAPWRARRAQVRRARQTGLRLVRRVP
jgi:hypothetical protein